MNSVSAKEILDMVCYQWAGTKEIMKIGSVGQARALRIKKEIANNLLEKGYTLPRNKVPMEAVIKYFKINLEYLRKTTSERSFEL